MRNRAFRRHKTYTNMWRRLKEDRNQHYNDLSCFCYTDKKVMARFKEQPKLCNCVGCSNQRHAWGKKTRSIQERKFYEGKE